VSTVAPHAVPSRVGDPSRPLGRGHLTPVASTPRQGARDVRVKRLLDITVALALIVVTLPLALLVAAAIKLDSPGPIIFRQLRVGQHGRVFWMYKFRSMVCDAEQVKAALAEINEADGPFFKLRRDPRVTRVGHVIRRLSLDELPQLFNVLLGEMSVVGPRPALPSELAAAPAWFRRRLEVPQGLTGLWQVSGRFQLPFRDAARLDLHYVERWGLGLDLLILARTVPAILFGKGAR
jgi:lipopolysaccharide/colanic/teichoic acid biosynthesis glycosyltransferase